MDPRAPDDIDRLSAELPGAMTCPACSVARVARRGEAEAVVDPCHTVVYVDSGEKADAAYVVIFEVGSRYCAGLVKAGVEDRVVYPEE
mmetsp:Transcript_112047/g.317286  ORF Transcript_112047/g.317286 Transcript_112047/m.317286 type:complete len:88 (-) Transcript_112047:271-534(-)